MTGQKKTRSQKRQRPAGRTGPKLPKDPALGGKKKAGFRTRASSGPGSKLGLGGRGAFQSPVGPRVERMLDNSKRRKATEQATPSRQRANRGK
jgi:hypothetical protein